MQRLGRPPTSVLKSINKLAPIACAILLVAVLQTGSPAPAQSSATRITFADSIKPVTATTPSVAKNTPTLVRNQLTDVEMQETVDFSIALKMRDFTELQQRVG